MIVVAIIGILAAIALPGYQNYTIRAQVTDGLTLADGWKTAIAEYYALTGNWPSQGNRAGTNNSTGKYESCVTVTSGAIAIVYGAQSNKKISGFALSPTPFTTSNLDILWKGGSVHGRHVAVWRHAGHHDRVLRSTGRPAATASHIGRGAAYCGAPIIRFPRRTHAAHRCLLRAYRIVGR